MVLAVELHATKPNEAKQCLEALIEKGASLKIESVRISRSVLLVTCPRRYLWAYHAPDGQPRLRRERKRKWLSPGLSSRLTYLNLYFAQTDARYTPFYRALELHADELAKRIIGHPEFDRNEKCHKVRSTTVYSLE